MVMNEWRFEEAGKEQVIRVTPAMVCDDGALLRQWALSGAGIAGKSWWDVKRDVEEGRLQVLFADRFTGFSRLDRKEVGLQFVFPQRKLQPLRYRRLWRFYRLAGRVIPSARGESEQNMTSAHLAEDNTIEKTVAQPDTHPDKQFGILTDGITGRGFEAFTATGTTSAIVCGSLPVPWPYVFGSTGRPLLPTDHTVLWPNV